MKAGHGRREGATVYSRGKRMRDISGQCSFLLGAALSAALQTSHSLAQGHQDWSANLGIYEVNTRQYTGEGTFAAFEGHLDRLKEMGAGILWFMPIHPIGLENRLGTLGSYYSVRDYLEVNPEFGTIEDFRTLVSEIHGRGMQVLIDWVAGHTSWDNPLTVEHPEWYRRDSDGNFTAPSGTNWSDVVELDYSQPGLRAYMIEAMKYWALDVGVDGFRCDAVSRVPKDFWEEAIAELRAAKPGLFMLAEADGRQWHDAGFDMTYAWGLYGFGGGVLKRIADGSGDAADLDRYLTTEGKTYSAGSYRMVFTSNHDENSWWGTTDELFGEAANAFAVLTATCAGMPLIYSGQEAGLDKRLLFFDKDSIVWRVHPNADLYSKLLHLKRKNRSLWNGDRGGPRQRVPTTDDAGFYSFVRQKEGDKVLVALNLSDQVKDVKLLGNSFIGSYRDVFTGESVDLAADAVLTLPAWGYFVCEAVRADTDSTGGTGTNGFSLGQNYPNPFKSVTRIRCVLTTIPEAVLTVCDRTGREVRAPERVTKQAGGREILFDAAGLPSGLYCYRLRAGNRTETKRMLLLR